MVEERCVLIREQIAELQDELADREAKLPGYKKAIEKLRSLQGIPISSEELLVARDEVTKASATQGQLDVYKNRKTRKEKAEANLKSTRNKEQGYDKVLNEVEETRKQRLCEANFPIEGLSVSDEAVLLNNVPLSQISHGEQIMISTMIGMKLNPDLRVLFIRDASLLDSDNYEAISKAAKDQDYQIWMERTDESGKVGIYMEDGSIKAVDGKKSNPAAAAVDAVPKG